jgi:peptidyl-dipeptidase Dcp
MSRRLLALAIIAIAVVCSTAAQQSAVQTNPLLAEWTTPFGVPPFAEIKPGHFLPAIKRGVAEQRKEVEAIATNPQPPTVVNTVEALENAGELLAKVSAVFSNLSSADTNDQLQAINRETVPLLSALRDDIRLNPTLFGRVKAVWDQRAQLNLTPVQAKLLENTYKSFVRSGANLGAEQKDRLRKINAEISMLGVKFGDNLLQYLNQIVSLFNAHMHPGQMAGPVPVTPAPPVAPFTPPTPDLVSMKVKVG